MSVQEKLAMFEEFRKLAVLNDDVKITIEVLQSKLLEVYNNCNPENHKTTVDKKVEKWAAAVVIEGDGSVNQQLKIIIELMTLVTQKINSKKKTKKQEVSNTGSSGSVGSDHLTTLVNRKFKAREAEFLAVAVRRIDSSTV